MAVKLSIQEKILTVFIILSLTSCITFSRSNNSIRNEEIINNTPKVTEPDVPEWVWDTLPQGNTLFFIAFSPRYSDVNYEEYFMLKNAALQVGVFSNFWGASQDVLDERVNRSLLIGRTRAHYDGVAEDKAMYGLELVEAERMNTEAWGKFKLEWSDFPILNWHPDFKNGLPTWIRAPPVIPGWIVGVANGRRQSTMSLSIRKADEAVLDEIIRQVHGNQQSEAIYRQKGSENFSQSGGKIISSGQGFGVIRGFLVVARCFDGSDMWSFAVCPEEWNVRNY